MQLHVNKNLMFIKYCSIGSCTKVKKIIADPLFDIHIYGDLGIIFSIINNHPAIYHMLIAYYNVEDFVKDVLDNKFKYINDRMAWNNWLLFILSCTNPHILKMVLNNVYDESFIHKTVEILSPALIFRRYSINETFKTNMHELIGIIKSEYLLYDGNHVKISRHYAETNNTTNLNYQWIHYICSHNIDDIQWLYDTFYTTCNWINIKSCISERTTNRNTINFFINMQEDISDYYRKFIILAYTYQWLDIIEYLESKITNIPYDVLIAISIRSNNYDLVVKFIDKPINLNDALYIACIQGRYNIIELLLNAGADITHDDYKCVRAAPEKWIYKLINRTQDEDINLIVVLFIQAMCYNKKYYNKLWNNYSTNPIFINELVTLAYDDACIAKHLIKHDITLPSISDCVYQHLLYEDRSIVEHTLKTYGIRLNDNNELVYLINNNKYDTIELLRDYGMTIDFASDDFIKSVDESFESDYVDNFINYVVKIGVNVDLCLTYALKYCDLSAARILLDYGANIYNHIDLLLDILLSKTQCVDCINLLIDYEIDICNDLIFKSKFGKNIKNINCITELIIHGLDLIEYKSDILRLENIKHDTYTMFILELYGYV